MIGNSQLAGYYLSLESRSIGFGETEGVISMAARTNAPASTVKKLSSSPKANQPTTNIVGSSMLPAMAALMEH